MYGTCTVFVRYLYASKAYKYRTNTVQVPYNDPFWEPFFEWVQNNMRQVSLRKGMNSDKANRTGNGVLVLVAMVLGVLIGVMTVSNQRRHASPSVDGKVAEVTDLIEHEYVDAIDADTLGERLLAAMLAELDPHSSYLSVRETERTDEMMRGTFEGVGLVLHREGDTTYVGQVLADGPSARSGLLPGDMIVAVDGERVSGVGMTADSVVARLRGPRGTKVRVEALRHGMEKEEATIRRGVVGHRTVACATMIDDTTGYIILTSFASTSDDEFRTALADLKRRGMRHLVFDLRGNGGGSLSSAVGIAGELLKAGSPIVYTQGAHSRRRDVKSTVGGRFTTGRLTVLVDENSASASEVVAGALQDNDRATIAGRRTFGKGLVQSEFQLSDGSSVMLTTARYYTPSGRCIQRSYEGGTSEYYREYLEQLMDEAYADTAWARIVDTTPYLTLGGRTVYGGGGIVPDRLIAYRKDRSFVYYNTLANKGLLDRVAFGEVKENAGRWLAEYADADAFCKGFHASGAMVEKLVKEGERAGIARDAASLAAQRPLIECMLKAYVGLALFGNEAFYAARLEVDDDLKELGLIR